MRPYFSIIIPTLNEERDLPKLLRSLRRQSFADFELIVVDGESVDKTKEIVERYQKLLPRLKLVTSEKKGPGVQRNMGAKKASGKYLIFFDADVEIPEEFLEGIHYYIIRHKPSFLTTWVYVDSVVSGDTVIALGVNMALEFAKSIGKPAVPGFNFIVKRQVFNKVKGFDENLKLSEDMDLAGKICNEGYDLEILKEPKLKMSLRRLRTEGTLKIFRKFMLANLYTLLKGPITTQIFDYQMGGHVHRKRRKKRLNLMEWNNYIKNMEKLGKRLNKFLVS